MQAPKYWIFTVKPQRDGSKLLAPDEILEQRIKDRFWGLAENTPSRKSLSEGDQVVFYLGIPRKQFAARAKLASGSFRLNQEQRKQYSHGKELYLTDHGVQLHEAAMWETPIAVEEVIPKLAFIENKKNWGAYFQGGIRQLTEEDFKRITGDLKPSLADRLAESRDIESQAEFALEDHLEEFIYQNWSKINWGSKLELYKIGDQDGRQFPAGTWSIDFLAVDQSNNELVVIELKRGQTSDSTFGQVSRYMSWVKENIAKEGQKVRGIVVAREIDDALIYAVKSSRDVRIKRYKVDFQLVD